MLLREGKTCGRVARAPRATLLVDMQCYFEAARTAMLSAKRSIHFLNWAFEEQTFLIPGPDCSGDPHDRIGTFLKELAERKPELDVRVLCWDASPPIAATQGFFPVTDMGFFKGSRVRFQLDAKLPFGACHHQKMIIIDDNLAFCGGGDIGPDRWDTDEHLDDDPRREKTRRDHKDYDSRHEVMGLVDGDAAVMLAEVFRDRWRRATGEALPPAPAPGPAAWPEGVGVDFRHIAVGAARTCGAWRDEPEVREVERLHLGSIAAAKRLIYMENQYFTSPLIAEALAARLREADGPEVVLISTEHSPSWFDQMTMDKTRFDFVSHLKAADGHRRFRAYSPVTAKGKIIIVHAKLTIIDDALLRIGSANINNRSMGFDTECDLVFEATEAAHAERIAALRRHILAHWIGCPDETVEAALARGEGRLCPALDALRTGGSTRMRPIEPGRMNPFSAFVAKHHIGDPIAPADAWAPWKRRPALRRRLTDAALDPAAASMVPGR